MAHLGTAHTLALAEQCFYWPGMRADVSKICTECHCEMLTTEATGAATSIHRRGPDGTLGHIPSPRRGTNTASWWGAISRNGLSASPSRIRRPRRSLGSSYMRLWHDMEHSESCIAIRARISGQRWCWRCVGCSEYTSLRAGMDSRHNVGTKPRNQVAVPMVRSNIYHQGAGQGTRSRVPETGQTAHCGTCGSPRGV